MEKEFVPYEQALALKELDYKEKCLASFYTYDIENFKKNRYDYRGKFNIDYSSEDDYVINTDKSYYVATPTFSQAFRWFREKYDLHENVGIKHFIEKTYCYSIVSTSIPHYIHDKSHFASYEEAELECLKKLIEIVKAKK